MLEKIINLEAYSLIDLFGINDRHLNEIKDCFPQLKIIARGDMIKVTGEELAVDNFEKRFHLLLAQYDHFGKITDVDIKQIMQSEEEDQPEVNCLIISMTISHQPDAAGFMFSTNCRSPSCAPLFNWGSVALNRFVTPWERWQTSC